MKLISIKIRWKFSSRLETLVLRPDQWDIFQSKQWMNIEVLEIKRQI